MDVLVNVAEMWVLIARAGAIAMALYLLFGLWSARASLDEPPEHLAAYGAPKALRPVLTSILFSSALLLVWPPTAFVVAGAMAELSLRSQRGRAGGRAVELPAEGELALSVWRLFGWTAFGLVPVSLPAWLAPEAAPLRTLVAFSTVLGAWAALRGGPTPYPHAAELAWKAMTRADEAPPAPAPVVRRAKRREPEAEEAAEEAARPVPAEDDETWADARAAARRLAGAAIAAQLRAMERAAPAVEEPEEGPSPGAEVGEGPVGDGARDVGGAEPGAAPVAPEPGGGEPSSSEVVADVEPGAPDLGGAAEAGGAAPDLGGAAEAGGAAPEGAGEDDGPPVATATYEDTSVVDTAALMRAIAERSEAPAGESAEPPTEETPWA